MQGVHHVAQKSSSTQRPGPVSDEKRNGLSGGVFTGKIGIGLADSAPCGGLGGILRLFQHRMRLYSGGELRQPGFDFFGIVLDVLEFVAVEDPGSENIVEVGVYGSGIECIHFGQDRLERLPRGVFAEFVSEGVHRFVECFFSGR